MFTAIREDIQSVLNRDPAARSALEVLLCYQGLQAVWGHRLAHWFWNHHHYLIGRLISQVVRSQPRPLVLPDLEPSRQPEAIGVAVGQLVEC